MIRPSRIAMTLAAAFAVAAPATAQVFTTTLSGLNENPAAASAGTGTGIVTLDTIANTMRVQVTFSGLTGTTTASHIHCCTTGPGTNATVATITPTFTGFPLGVTSGTYDFTYDMTQLSSFNAAFVNLAINGGSVATARNTLFNGIANGTAYLNIHSTAFPLGEIRGAFSPAPEPGTWAMMLIGFAGVGLVMRRRRALVPA